MNNALRALHKNTPEQTADALRRAYRAGVITEAQIADALRALQLMAAAVEIGTAMRQRSHATLN